MADLYTFILMDPEAEHEGVMYFTTENDWGDRIDAKHFTPEVKDRTVIDRGIWVRTETEVCYQSGEGTVVANIAAKVPVTFSPMQRARPLSRHDFTEVAKSIVTAALANEGVEVVDVVCRTESDVISRDETP